MFFFVAKYISLCKLPRFFCITQKENGMLLKWRLSKLLSKDKEANKELDEWMQKQVDEKKTAGRGKEG